MALREELKVQGDFLFRYRSYFPLVLLVGGIVMIVVRKVNGGTESGHGYQLWLDDPAIFVSLLGLIIRAVAVGYSAKDTSGRNTAQGQIAGKLMTKGLYSITRNPLYLGNYLIWLGVAMLTCSLWFIGIFTLIFWIYYERIIYAEEEFLREKFGEAYLQWTARTPIFVPYKPRWQKADSYFNWKQIFIQEKNGLVALFVVFFLFDFLSTSFEYRRWTIDKPWLLVMVIISVILYLIFKIVQHRDSVKKRRALQ